MSTLTSAERRLLVGLGVLSRDTPERPDLIIGISRDEHWLESFAAAEVPADWCIEWNDLTVGATDDEPERRGQYRFGVFADLPAQLAAILAEPSRCPDSPVELDISAWALHYRNVPLAA